MQIRVGLSSSDLQSRLHKALSLKSNGSLKIETVNRSFIGEIEPGKILHIKAVGDNLFIENISTKLLHTIRIVPANISQAIIVTSLMRIMADGKHPPLYKGHLEISAVDGCLRAVLICDLDSYLTGVLGSEIPPSYHIEAIKAQAIAARTYALHPRVDHLGEGFSVCDSFLCCQNFVGNASNIHANYVRAIAETHNLILTYDSKPILALFSSCAGGHTESYENCFSDLKTGKFPPDPMPCLKAVPEGQLPKGFPADSALRKLWHEPHPLTCDAWSGNFRWKVELTANQLESHMHHVINTMQSNSDFAPFIKPPQSNQFGHINSFQIAERGPSGVVIDMNIHTSTGTWVIAKELVIRSVFQNPDLHLSRLKSARIFFDHIYDHLGLLSNLTIYGFGFGHGVGLQQVGAQGLALAGKSYKDILRHYYQDSHIEQIS